MNDLPELYTERLILNRPTLHDLEDFLFHINSTEDYSKTFLTSVFPFRSSKPKNGWNAAIWESTPEPRCDLLFAKKKQAN